ncbi:MAG TPA: D-alanyl-D-alanine carboxypeptidase family protein [Dermatophilaceae bacterium]|nr:D-alanyl-D-alanine carboxypeptidase family protein [Dermatophilaceae bacterium]
MPGPRPTLVSSSVSAAVPASRRRRRPVRTVGFVLLAGVLAATVVVARAPGDLRLGGARSSHAPSAEGSLAPVAPGAPVAPESAPPSSLAVETAAPSGASPAPMRNGEGFLPVVTDRIPAPARTFALRQAVPGTTNMQPAAASAVARAIAAARRAGVAISIRSAWRSERFQRVLFDRAVARYGSPEQAAKWVLAPEDSAHVKGYAVDVQPRSAGTWLEAHGTAYGLCRTYDNEWWHFEYLATRTCPARKENAAG